jgi:hypothetical protein
MDDFLNKVPFNGKIRDTKRKLKITSMSADSLFMPTKNKSMQEAITPAKNPKIR